MAENADETREARLADARAAARRRLRAAADALAERLPDHGPPRLAACGCPVCLHPDNRRLLETVSRDRITLAALRDYLQSVEAGDLTDAEADYLTPVIFEALAAGLEPHPLGDYLAFQRLGRAARPARWPEATRAAATEAFAALAGAAPLHAWLESPQFREHPARFYGLSIGDLAAAALDAGADLDTVLAALDALPTEPLARAVYGWIGRIDYGDGGWWALDPRGKTGAALDEQLRAWLGRPELRRRLEAAFFAPGEAEPAEVAALLSETHWLLVCQFGALDGETTRIGSEKAG